MDGRWVNVEGPGNGADRLPVSDEFPGQFLLVWPHFLWPSERNAARLGGQSFADRVVDVGLVLIEARLDIEVRDELHEPSDAGQVSRAPCNRPDTRGGDLTRVILVDLYIPGKKPVAVSITYTPYPTVNPLLSVTSVVPRANSSTSLTPLIMGPFR
jgi:hypothetical protein